MPFADAMDYADDMKRIPPVHVLVAGYFGFPKPEAHGGDEPPSDWPSGPVGG